MNANACPRTEELSQLSVGLLTEEVAAQHESHISDCPKCQTSLQNLSVTDDLINSLRASDETDAELESITLSADVEELIPRLQQLDVRFTDDGNKDGIDVRMLLSPAKQPDEIGRFAGFRVLEYLGQGGMGIVFRAEDEALHRPVALKVLNPVLAASRVACRRFERETQAVAAFEHDHIVTIYQVGDEHGLPYFAMQLLDGESLGDRLRRETNLSPEQVLRIGREIATGLMVAHDRGLLHRDIKPDNIWLQSDRDRVCIVDFGLARLSDGESRLTAVGSVIGTPDYMAPEQAQGGDIDQRCDLFSLGCLMYHAATGKVPFERNTPVATLVAVSEQDVVPPEELNVDVPPRLSSLILRLLEKDPQRRPDSAEEVVAQIQQIEGSAEPPPAMPTISAGKLSPLWTAIIAAAATLLLSVLILKRTEHGTLVVETFDDAITADVRQEKILLRDTETGHEVEVSIGNNEIRPGEYEIVVKDHQSGLSFSTTSFSLLNGREKRVTVTLKPADSGSNVSGMSDVDSAQVAGQISDVGSDSDHAVASNKAAALAALTRSITMPATLPVKIAPGDALGGTALVQTPQRLNGLRSWTIETRDHRGPVEAIAVHPDGTLIATGGSDATIRIWDAMSQKLLQIIYDKSPLRKVEWSPDGRFLATISLTHTRILNAANYLAVYETQERAATLAWSPGCGVVAMQIGGIRFLHLDSMKVKPSFGITGSFSHRPWSPDGRFFATESGKLWDLSTQANVQTFSGNVVESVWSTRNNFLLLKRTRSSSSKVVDKVEVWDVDRFENIPISKVKHSREVRDGWSPKEMFTFAWSSDEKEISLDLTSLIDERAVEFEPRPTDQAASLSSAVDVCFGPDRRTFVGLYRGRAYVGNIESKELTPFAGFYGIMTSYVTGGSNEEMASYPYMAEGVAGTVWNLRTLSVNPNGHVRTREYRSPDGRRTALVKSAGKDEERNQLTIFDANEVEPLSVTPLSMGTSIWHAVRWSPDSRLLALHSFKTPSISILQPDNPKTPKFVFTRKVSRVNDRELRSLTGGLNTVPFDWSPSGDSFLWCGQEYVQIIDSKSFEVLHYLSEEPIAEPPEPKKSGNLLSAIFGSNRNRGQPPRTYPVTTAVNWSADGSMIAVGTSIPAAHKADPPAPHKIVVWKHDAEMETWSIIRTVEIPQEGNSSVSAKVKPRLLKFSPEGQRIAWENPCSVAHIETGEIISLPKDERSEFLAWADNGKIVVATSGPNGTRNCEYGIWNVLDNSLNLRPRRYFDHVRATTSGVAHLSESQMEYRDTNLNLLSTVLFSHSRDGTPAAVAVKPDGFYRNGSPNVDLQMVVMHDDGTQRLLTPQEFEAAFGWRNDPDAAFPDGVWKPKPWAKID